MQYMLHNAKYYWDEVKGGKLFRVQVNSSAGSSFHHCGGRTEKIWGLGRVMFACS